jgi:hypothetical protein
LKIERYPLKNKRILIFYMIYCAITPLIISKNMVYGIRVMKNVTYLKKTLHLISKEK